MSVVDNLPEYGNDVLVLTEGVPERSARPVIRARSLFPTRLLNLVDERGLPNGMVVVNLVSDDDEESGMTAAADDPPNAVDEEVFSTVDQLIP
jgi:hypothetical protein